MREAVFRHWQTNRSPNTMARVLASNHSRRPFPFVSRVVQQLHRRIVRVISFLKIVAPRLTKCLSSFRSFGHGLSLL